MRPDLLADLMVFRTVADERSFTRAASRLGVTQSALSQKMKYLEKELGLRLLARTTRSVAPTEAGLRMLATLSPALDGITAELNRLADFRERPAGTLRITSGKHAADTILWPAAVRLMTAHPDIRIEIHVAPDYLDLVAEGFDAGVRLGERLEQDMIAVPVGASMRSAVVASPSYVAEHGRPTVPKDLAAHRCIGFRSPGGRLYAWEFERSGQEVVVKVGGGPIVNDGDLLVSAATQGFGFAYVLEDLVADEIAAGRLVRVLDDWCEPFGGYHLFYPSRRQQTYAFRLLVEALRRPT